jgi:enoyl-CoA hydratase/carnithine racemase
MSTETFELTIRGPGRNALSSAVMQELLARLREAAGRPLLLCGAEGAFSAGLNLKEVTGLDHDGMAHFLGLLDDLIDALYLYPGPTVACVNGHAIAGGCILVLCCDLRIAAADPSLRIGLNEVPLGLEFPPKLMALVRARVPPRWRDRVVLEGALHDPRAALELGLVDEVASDARLAAATALARLASSPPETYVANKRALRRGALDLSEADRRHFAENVVPAWCAPESKERLLRALKSR